MHRFLEELAGELDALDGAELRRRPRTIEPLEGMAVRLEGRVLTNWCSNDYLGLSRHPVLVRAAGDAAARWGVGARASRLLGGSLPVHEDLERGLAEWVGMDSAIVFASGYLANLGALTTLLEAGDLVLADRLSHASLIDAARASRATLKVFRHNDAAQVERLLAKAARFRRRLIVTEGVFSMEGDRGALAALHAAASAHNALVYVDDAHGAFLSGPDGRGSPEAAGLPSDGFLYMATLGKALGCQGGFLAGPRPLIDLLQTRARTFVYATAPAAPVMAAAAAALALLHAEPQLRETLQARTRQLHERLRRAELPGLRLPLEQPSHIVPLIAGSSASALSLSRRLLEQGCWAPPIRPPTVPDGTARLRLSVTALHTPGDIDRLVRALEASCASQRAAA
jgi:8-amino-7-oxononanoate synthase